MRQCQHQWMRHFRQCHLILVDVRFSFINVEGMKDKVGDFDTELVEEFFLAFTNNAKINLHINLQYGKNTHHIIESIFKGFGRALRVASTINPDVKGVPSTKGAVTKSRFTSTKLL